MCCQNAGVRVNLRSDSLMVVYNPWGVDISRSRFGAENITMEDSTQAGWKAARVLPVT